MSLLLAKELVTQEEVEIFWQELEKIEKNLGAFFLTNFIYQMAIKPQ